MCDGDLERNLPRAEDFFSAAGVRRYPRQAVADGQGRGHADDDHPPAEAAEAAALGERPDPSVATAGRTSTMRSPPEARAFVSASATGERLAAAPWRCTPC